MKISWVNPKLENRKIANKNYGIFTKKEIKTGERVLAFGGYVLDIKNLKKLQGDKKRSYEAIMKVGYQVDDDLIFSPTYYNQFSIAEYLNHSCDANCGFKNQIILLAMKDIKKDEEITMDYATCITSSLFNMKCLCGKMNCRKNITGEDWKISELQKKYKGYFQPYIEEKIKKLKSKK